MQDGVIAAAGRALALLAAAMLLSACGSGGDSAPGAVTEGEQRALADAAEMLDERPAPTPRPQPVAKTTTAPAGP